MEQFHQGRVKLRLGNGVHAPEPKRNKGTSRGTTWGKHKEKPKLKFGKAGSKGGTFGHAEVGMPA